MSCVHPGAVLNAAFCMTCNLLMLVEEGCCVPVVVKESGGLSRGVLKYVVCLCSGCDGCCVFCLYCEAWSCKCSCMGSVSVSSCRCCMFVSCVHHVAVLNAAFCMTFNLICFFYKEEFY